MMATVVKNEAHGVCVADESEQCLQQCLITLK